MMIPGGKIEKMNWRSATTPAGMGSVAFLTLLVFAILSHAPAQAQTYSVLYNFTGGADGGNMVSTPALDVSGNLYGAAFTGGAGFGTVFELSPSGSGWSFNTLYSFLGTTSGDGAGPSGILVGPNGTLFGANRSGRQKVPRHPHLQWMRHHL